MTNKEIFDYLRVAVGSLSSGRRHFAANAEDAKRHRREEAEVMAAIEFVKVVWASSDQFPQTCFLCGQELESEDDRQWHGLGNCVEFCTRCGGSGEEPTPESEVKR